MLNDSINEALIIATQRNGNNFYREKREKSKSIESKEKEK